MNNKGFTLVELITTFVLTSIIVVILLNIVVIIKDIYVKYEIKTEMLIKQGELSSYVNDVIANGSLQSYTKVSNTEFVFVTNTGSYTLKVENNIISFGDYRYEAGNSVTIDTSNIVSTSSWSTGSGTLRVKIPIKHSLYPNSDFGLNLVYVE